MTLYSDLTGNLPTIRQFTMVRKFRSMAVQIKTRNPNKKGKVGVAVRSEKKSLLNLQIKLQGGVGALGEIEEDSRAESENDNDNDNEIENNHENENTNDDNKNNNSTNSLLSGRFTLSRSSSFGMSSSTSGRIGWLGASKSSNITVQSPNNRLPSGRLPGNGLPITGLQNGKVGSKGFGFDGIASGRLSLNGCSSGSDKGSEEGSDYNLSPTSRQSPSVSNNSSFSSNSSSFTCSPSPSSSALAIRRRLETKLQHIKEKEREKEIEKEKEKEKEIENNKNVTDNGTVPSSPSTSLLIPKPIIESIISNDDNTKIETETDKKNNLKNGDNNNDNRNQNSERKNDKKIETKKDIKKQINTEHDCTKNASQPIIIPSPSVRSPNSTSTSFYSWDNISSKFPSLSFRKYRPFTVIAVAATSGKDSKIENNKNDCDDNNDKNIVKKSNNGNDSNDDDDNDDDSMLIENIITSNTSLSSLTYARIISRKQIASSNNSSNNSINNSNNSSNNSSNNNININRHNSKNNINNNNYNNNSNNSNNNSNNNNNNNNKNNITTTLSTSRQSSPLTISRSLPPMSGGMPTRSGSISSSPSLSGSTQSIFSTGTAQTQTQNTIVNQTFNTTTITESNALIDSNKNRNKNENNNCNEIGNDNDNSINNSNEIGNTDSTSSTSLSHLFSPTFRKDNTCTWSKSRPTTAQTQGYHTPIQTPSQKSPSQDPSQKSPSQDPSQKSPSQKSPSQDPHPGSHNPTAHSGSFSILKNLSNSNSGSSSSILNLLSKPTESVTKLSSPILKNMELNSGESPRSLSPTSSARNSSEEKKASLPVSRTGTSSGSRKGLLAPMAILTTPRSHNSARKNSNNNKNNNKDNGSSKDNNNKDNNNNNGNTNNSSKISQVGVDGKSSSILEEIEGELCSISDHDSSPRSGILSARSKTGNTNLSRISSMSSVHSHISNSGYNMTDMLLENDIEIIP